MRRTILMSAIAEIRTCNQIATRIEVSRVSDEGYEGRHPVRGVR